MINYLYPTCNFCSMNKQIHVKRNKVFEQELPKSEIENNKVLRYIRKDIRNEINTLSLKGIKVIIDYEHIGSMFHIGSFSIEVQKGTKKRYLSYVALTKVHYEYMGYITDYMETLSSISDILRSFRIGIEFNGDY